MIGQPCLRKFEMQKYFFHLIRYYDNHFSQHPRFWYYLYNLMLQHHSQATIVVFVKINLKEGFPMIVLDLCACLHAMPDSMPPDQIMRFRSGLRWTHSFWNKHRGELTNMIIQIGIPTFFFTLNATDTK